MKLKRRSSAYPGIEVNLKFTILKDLVNLGLEKNSILRDIHTGGKNRYAQEPSNKVPVLQSPATFSKGQHTDLRIAEWLIYVPRHAVCYFASSRIRLVLKPRM